MMKVQDKENIRNLSLSETYSAVISVKWGFILDNTWTIELELIFVLFCFSLLNKLKAVQPRMLLWIVGLLP